MPKRTDIRKVLVIGSGPVIIGQAGEFDYAGSQVCQVLKEEGYQVVVINSNPATLITDQQLADSVYIEALTVESLEKVIAVERPDGIFAAFGGQTSLNLGIFLAREGILEKYKVKLLGVEAEAIKKTEDRQKFRETMQAIGVKIPGGAVAKNITEGMEIGLHLGFPVVIKSSYALEGTGVMVAYNQEELEDFIEAGLNSSPIRQVSIEQSLYGWKELEFEVIRDTTDKCMIVSSLESIDPVGVHTGDSGVVIPAQSLSSTEYTGLAALCKRVVQELKVIGGVNLQFAQNPMSGDILLIEANPRFTRSSALVARATGFQIAGVSARLAMGLSLPEIANESNKETAVIFEPAINHIAVKLPRFNFEKFPAAESTLSTSMKAVGEAMAFGSNFKEAFQKAIRSLMMNRYGFGADGRDRDEAKLTPKEIKEKIINPNADRWFYLRYALKQGIPVKELVSSTKLDQWFINELAELVSFEKKLTTYALYNLTPEILAHAKQWGYSDIQLAYLLRTTEDEVRLTRLKKEIHSHTIPVKTWGMPGNPGTPFFFSTYHNHPQGERRVSKGNKVLIFGTGPHRIGQSGEYDYCIVHAAAAVIRMGFQSIIVNCNPIAISTDPAHMDILYFEPLTKEDILNIVTIEEPVGAILQFSGSSSLNLVSLLQKAGVKILGTSPDSFERSSNWCQRKEILKKLGQLQPGNGSAVDIKGAQEIAGQISYPVIIRPTYIAGDKTARIIYRPEELEKYVEQATGISQNNPLLIEKYLDDAIGIVVDCVSDGKDLIFCGIMEQIEEAGINPGDSACSLPPYSIGEGIIAKIKENTGALVQELRIIGLLHVQFAIKHDSVYLLQIDPRASSMIPFISKASGVDWTAVATKVMLEASLRDQGVKEIPLDYTAIKEAVFSFDRFPGVDTVLGPEMRSTGIVMGINSNFGLAFIKAQLAAGEKIPTTGRIFMSIRDEDKRAFTSITRQLIDLGFHILATEETAAVLNRNNLPCQPVFKVGEGRPNIIDKIKNGEIQWIISTSSGYKNKPEDILVRSIAIQRDIPIITTVSGAQAAVIGLEQYLSHPIEAKPIHEYYSKK